MKIQCNTEVIRKAVQVIRNVVPGKKADVFLKDILVNAKDGALVLSTTDLAVSLQYRIDNATIDEPGVMLCPESKLAPILNEWPDETIDINESEEMCCIKGKDSLFKIMCEDPETFPKITKFKDEKCIEIDRDALADMLRKTVFIGGDVFLKVKGDEAIMVSNDGRRLAEVRRKVENTSGINTNCIIPIKTISQISNIIKDHEGAVKIKIEKKRVFVQAGSITLCSQLREAQYPDYTDVIPKELDKEITVEREAFFSAVRRGAVMTTDEYKLLSFTIEAGKMQLVCNSPDVGEAQVEMDVEYEGDKIVIGLNPDYIIDLSKVLDTEKITLKLKDSATACLFDVMDTYRYVIMPMELNV